jgi:hypothetical protein
MEFYSAMKKNKIFSFTSKCMELESIILIEVSQAQEANVIILLDMGRTLRVEYIHEE